MVESEVRHASPESINKLQQVSNKLSKEGTTAGLTTLGGTAASSFIPIIGTAVAATVAVIGIAYVLSKLVEKIHTDEELHKLEE